MTQSFWEEKFSWAYAGVDHTLAGNGGRDCINFIPWTQKIIETCAFIALSIFELCYAYPRLKLPEKLPPPQKTGDRTGKKVLLAVMCLTYGIEIGFKFATKQMIWVLNPCHMVTMTQIYLLIAPPTKLTMAIFRVHMHCLGGATIAVIFPVINTRLLTFETEVYYLQHILMLVVPYYLMRLGGVYTPEPLWDLTWGIMACGVLYFYHWTLMQVLATLTYVNLNNMMCPAISDPFYGRWYRICAAIHQTIFIPLHGKTYTFIAQKFLPAKQEEEVTNVNNAIESNGHVKLH